MAGTVVRPRKQQVRRCALLIPFFLAQSYVIDGREVTEESRKSPRSQLLLCFIYFTVDKFTCQEFFEPFSATTF